MGLLTDHLGDWHGTNAFRLTPDDEPYAAPMTVRVTAAVRGLVTELAYSWSHAEAGDQDGLLVLSAAQEPPGLVALWSDTFHAQPGAMTLTGTAGDGSLTLGCAYAGDWRWDVVLDHSAPDRLGVRMDNVVPESAAAQGYPPGAYWAMRADLVRPGG